MNSNSLTQYLDLYAQHREAIDARAPEAFNRLRPAAFEALQRAGRLPRKGDEGYARTDVAAMFAPDFGINIMRVPAPVDVAASLRCEVPNISTLMGVVAGDEFRPTATLLRNLPEGVRLMSLAEAARREPQLVEAYLGRLSAEGDAAAQLNTLLAQDGVLLHVAAGVQCDKPLQLINIFNAGVPSMAVRRVLVVLAPGAKPPPRSPRCSSPPAHPLTTATSRRAARAPRARRPSSPPSTPIRASASTAPPSPAAPRATATPSTSTPPAPRPAWQAW